MTNDSFLGESQMTGLAQVVRPTLIAAIGGTGSAAAKYAKSRLKHFVGADHHYVGIRAFDTDFQDAKKPRLVENSEYIYLGGFNAQELLVNIMSGRAYRHWKDWLPPKLNFQQVAFGAGGVRPMGRLCYFYQRNRIREAVEEALKTITDKDLAYTLKKNKGIQVNLQAGIDIHVIGSVCGGTGSGMFLDLAFDLRRWAEEATASEVTVTGHLVLPEAFRNKPVVIRALEANAYAALNELDRYMNASSRTPWKAEYQQGCPEESFRAPFDRCFLLSGLQHGGSTDVETLTAVIGETVTLLTTSQVGKKITGGMINMAANRQGTKDQHGRACCYSSYGLLALEVPDDLLGLSLGNDLAVMAHERLSKAVPETESAVNLGGDDQCIGILDGSRSEKNEHDPRSVMKSALARFTERLDLRKSNLEVRVPKPNPDLTSVEIFKKREGESSSTARTELQVKLREAHEHAYQEAQSLIAEGKWDIDELRGIINRELVDLLPCSGGLAMISKYLDECHVALKVYREELRARSEQVEKEANSLKNGADMLERGDLSKRDWSSIGEGIQDWHEFAQKRMLLHIIRGEIPQVSSLVNSFAREFIDPWRRIRTMLQNLNFAKCIEEDAYYSMRRALSSVCPLNWFQQQLKPYHDILLGDVLKELIREPQSWVRLHEKELSQKFYDICANAIKAHFKGQTGMDCESLFWKRYAEDQNAEQFRDQVEAAFDRAAPCWELDEAYELRGNLLEISGVGLRLDSSFYRNLRESHHTVSCVNEQREDYVPIIRTEHGLSLAGLKRIEAYRTSLLSSVLQEQRYDFHFFNDQRWLTQMEFPAEEALESESLYLFSMAIRLGIIARRKGKGYVLIHGAEEKELGSHRRGAYEKLANDSDIIKEVHTEIKKIANNPGFLDTLQDWIDTLQGRLHQIISHEQNDRTLRGEAVLCRDIFQVHMEIRALRAQLREEDLGI